MPVFEINTDEMIAKQYADIIGPRVEGDENAFNLFRLGFYSGFVWVIHSILVNVSENPNGE